MKVRKVDFSPDEFLVGVTGMKAIDIAVYWVTCALQMSSGRAVHVADSRLFSIIDARAPDIKASLERLVAAGKLQRDGDELVNNRVRKEIKSAAKRIRTARENGANGGRPRKNSNGLENRAGSAGQNPPGKLSPSPPSSPSSPSSDEDTPVAPKGAGKRVKAKKPPEYSHAFSQFWDLYPHKVAKDAAWKAWLKLIEQGRMPAFQVIADAIAAYIAAKPSDRSWANPATWLNGGRWMDAPHAPAEAGKPAAEPPPDLKGWRLAFWKGEGEAMYRGWIEGCKVSKDADGIVTMLQPTRFRCDHVRTNWAGKIERYMRAEDPGIRVLKVDVQAAKPASEAAE